MQAHARRAQRDALPRLSTLWSHGERLVRGTRRLLPRGRGLPEEVWIARHGSILILLWLHVPGALLFALATGHEVLHANLEAAAVAVPALVATWSRPSRVIRSSAASFGLMISSAVLVHLSGGYIEAHFHFFVVIGVLALYQHWAPFLTAVGYVVAHHGIAGSLDPRSVSNHQAALEAPLLWAAIHGAFILAASVVSLVAWRLVERQTLHDPLTDLPNRLLFSDRAAGALSRATRNSKSLGLLFIDLNDFKAVNDRLGHAAGDALLKLVASRLKTTIRGSDTAARLGGDEFAVLLEDVGGVPDVLQFAERIFSVLAEPCELAGTSVRVHASIGVAFSEGGRVTEKDLVRHADEAMYRAKRGDSGRKDTPPSIALDLVPALSARRGFAVLEVP